MFGKNYSSKVLQGLMQVVFVIFLDLHFMFLAFDSGKCDVKKKCFITYRSKSKIINRCGSKMVASWLRCKLSVDPSNLCNMLSGEF